MLDLKTPIKTSRLFGILYWRPETPQATQQPEASRDARLDLGRCLGALAVIYLHCADRYTWNGPVPIKAIADLIYANTLFCVPLFFMISGMLLIGRKVDPFLPYMKKRLLTVLKPFAFGALVYLIWQIIYQRNPPTSLFSYIQSLLSGSPFFHLWFLPVLFSLYLLLPLFQNFSPGIGKSIAGTVAILFVLSSAQTFLGPFSLSLGSFDGISNNLPYFLSGYCLSKVFGIDRKFSIIACVLAPIGTAGLILLSSAIAGHRAGFVFEDFSSPLVILQSLAMFSLLLKARLTPLIARIATNFAPQTLGIYILHFAFMSMLTDLANATLHPSVLAIMLFVPPITFFVSDGCVRLLHLIPGMKGFV